MQIDIFTGRGASVQCSSFRWHSHVFFEFCHDNDVAGMRRFLDYYFVFNANSKIMCEYQRLERFGLIIIISYVIYMENVYDTTVSAE